MTYVTSAPREVITEHRKLPLEIPERVAPTEFYNSPCNLRHLARENGLLRNPHGFLLYRKAIGHSNLFDASIIFDTSQRVLDPMGRPVRRDQLTREENIVFSRMTKVVLQYMLEKYPEFQQLTDDLRFGPGVGIFIGNPPDNDAQQLSNGVTY